MFIFFKEIIDKFEVIFRKKEIIKKDIVNNKKSFQKWKIY